jgi:hypothetical protein
MPASLPVAASTLSPQALARMHTAIDDFSSPHPRFPLDLDYFTIQPLRFIKPFLINRPGDWKTVQLFAETLRKQILALPAEALEKGFSHGDLQGYHANVAPNGTLTFFFFPHFPRTVFYLKEKSWSLM